MRLVFDIETNGLLSDLTCIHIITAKDIDTGKVYDFKPSQIEEGLDLLSGADVLIGHNIIKFDIPAILKIYPNWLFSGQVIDTLVITRLIWTDLSDRDHSQTARGKGIPGKLLGSHSLAAWGHRLGEHKGDYDGGWAEWSEEMHSYAIQDVEVTARLWTLIEKQEYSQQAIDLEHQVASIMAGCERHGFSFNVSAATSLVAELTGIRADLEAELQDTFKPWYSLIEEITPLKTVNYKNRPGVVAGASYSKLKLNVFNPGSRQHIANRLTHFYKWEAQEFTPSGQPKIDETTLSHLDYPEAQLLNKYLTVQKRLGQLAEGKQGWLNAVVNDRIHGTYVTNGAVTGRATHRYPNIGQVPSTGALWGKECRELFQATPGRTLVGVDLSALELRCLSHFMGRFDQGAYGEELLKGDIHTANQLAAGLETRNQAKTFIYGFLYGAGAAKIGSIVGKGPKEGQRLKERFLSKTPALAKLIKAVTSASSKGHLKGLDGRKINIRHQYASLNSLLQSAGALLSKRWLVEIDEGLKAAGLDDKAALVAWVHDEVQIEADDDVAEQVKQIAIDAAGRAGDFFNFRIPITAEGNTGSTWADTH